MLASGYSADLSIFELRNLEDNLKRSEFKLSEISPRRKKDGDEVRRAGVPPGYLRP